MGGCWRIETPLEAAMPRVSGRTGVCRSGRGKDGKRWKDKEELWFKSRQGWRLVQGGGCVRRRRAAQPRRRLRQLQFQWGESGAAGVPTEATGRNPVAAVVVPGRRWVQGDIFGESLK